MGLSFENIGISRTGFYAAEVVDSFRIIGETIMDRSGAFEQMPGDFLQQAEREA